MPGLSYVGALATIYLALKAACVFWRIVKQYFLATAFGIDLKKLGEWAVVTGSTDGIGKAYAERLAKIGLNVVLVSRSMDKLDTVAKEIESKYGVKTKVISADFTGGPEIYDVIGQQLSGLDIAVLVNNVGMSYDFPMYLTEASDQVVRNIINVNCHSVTFMSKLVLQGMVEKKKGAIINISSLSGLQEAPLLTVYSATKAYTEFFSTCLREEYKSKGIIIQNVAPGFVATKLSKIRKSSLIVPNPQQFASSALATVGVASRTCGCLVHHIQYLVTSSLPACVYLPVTKNVLMGARVKGLKKQEDRKSVV